MRAEHRELIVASTLSNAISDGTQRFREISSHSPSKAFTLISQTVISCQAKYSSASGGPDDPAWVGAICPTCHREIHHGQNSAALNEKPQQRLIEIEDS
jgi:hypothetical protein